MNDKQAYSFTILRYVHDVIAGEFLNVGLVLHVPSAGILRVKTRESSGRLSQAFPDIDLPSFRSAMKEIEQGVTGLGNEIALGLPFDNHLDARRQALKVLPDDDSSLQWSGIGSGLTADVDETFRRLFQRYVARYDTEQTQRRSDQDIWRPVRAKLAERNLNVPFKRKVVSGVLDSIEFKSAWKNGSWHAYEGVSLDLADENGIKNKARRWRGHLDAVQQGCKEDMHLYFLVGAPQDESLVPAFRSAKDILAGSAFSPEVVEEARSDDLVDSIEREYLRSAA